MRMLGSGRPFVVELLSPRLKSLAVQSTLAELEKLINSVEVNVAVSQLDFTDNSCFAELTTAAAAKVKVYAAVIQSNRELSEELIGRVNGLVDIEIDQMTPLRVLHRRTLMNRDKFVYRCRLQKINAFTGLLVLLASAGTYIKEFVHGDLNRTTPNLGILMDCKCDIIQLDVLDLYPELSEDSLKKFEELVEQLKMKD